jgi:hypothetical protein
MKENQRIGAAIDLRVAPAQSAESSFAGRIEQSYGNTERSIGVTGFGRNESSGSSRILLTGRYDRFCANLPYGPSSASRLAGAGDSA